MKKKIPGQGLVAAMQPSTRKLLLLFLIFFFKRIWILSAFVSFGNRKPRVQVSEKHSFTKKYNQLFPSPQNNRRDNCQLTGNTEV